MTIEAEGWLPIASAPRDGSEIEVGIMLRRDGGRDMVCIVTVEEPTRMAWDSEAVNASLTRGAWRATQAGKLVVWSEGHDCSPTHWRPLRSYNGSLVHEFSARLIAEGKQLEQSEAALKRALQHIGEQAVELENAKRSIDMLAAASAEVGSMPSAVRQVIASARRWRDVREGSGNLDQASDALCRALTALDGHL